MESKQRAKRKGENRGCQLNLREGREERQERNQNWEAAGSFSLEKAESKKSQRGKQRKKGPGGRGRS